MSRLRYDKPHLTYEQQLELLVSRGMAVSDRPAALRAPERIGYYRLSAYCYPFRENIPRSERTFAHEYRRSTFVPGTTFDDAVRLYWFDVGLREVVFGALRELELELRAKLAYQVGAVHPFGFDSPEHAIDVSTQKRLKNYGRWESTFKKSLSQASRTDYIEHYNSKYAQKEPPIWILVETLDFGGVTSLYSVVITQSIQNQIARRFGIAQGSLLEDWLQNLRYVRNLSAHHSRLWNSRLNYPMSNTHLPHEDLAHTAGVRMNKIYVSLALMQYLQRSAGAYPTFRTRLIALMERFPYPANAAVSPQLDMGFPAQWADFSLWSDAPA